MKTRIAVLTAALVAMVAAAPYAQADDDETTVTVKTTSTVKGEGLRLSGRLTAPFSPRGEAAVEDDCIGDRRVEVSIKKPRGFRLVATDLTSPEGIWRVRVKEIGADYRVRVQPAEFSYSPAYGQLETVRCLGATIGGRLGRRGFRIDASVLGIRFTREESAGRLPTTGLPVGLYAVTGTSLILTGLVLLRLRPKRRRG